ncbi:MAG: ArgE/DapE family deacylase [Gemmatimonadota bacterium]|nr:ArgE/DapE family deacylase [Gemmatimonadota bacterium]
MIEPAATMAGLSVEEARVVSGIDEEGMFSLLAELIAIPSVANEESPAQELVATWMRSAGLETDVWEIDFASLRDHPAYSSDVERREGLGVVGALRGGGASRRGAGKTLILNGHVDVVPAGELERWTRPPFELTREGDRLFGRGVVDMKGQVCAALYAARALVDAKIELVGSLQVQSVIGEEDGGAGTLATLERGHTGDGAIVVEPTGFVVAPAQAGALSFRITVPGKAAHGALREEGVDPVEKFIPIFHGIRALEAERNSGVGDPLFASEELPFAITMGRLEAGIWPSTVAETLSVEGRYGIAPDEDLERARAALEGIVAEVAAADPWLSANPPVVDWWGAQFEAARTDPSDPVAGILSDAYRSITGDRPSIGGMRFGADMRLLRNVGGIPTVLFGPGDVREAHCPDESVSASELVLTAAVLAVTAMRFCGTR